MHSVLAVRSLSCGGAVEQVWAKAESKLRKRRLLGNACTRLLSHPRERIIETIMLARLKSFAERHPRLTAWIALATGMVIILVIAARNVGLLWNQWLFLILATIGLAGLCVWIISWEPDDEEQQRT